jgi:hypothetical protein
MYYNHLTAITLSRSIDATSYTAKSPESEGWRYEGAQTNTTEQDAP